MDCANANPGPLDPGLALAGDELFSSWHRCLHRYRLDPDCSREPQELSICDLARSRIAFSGLIESASEEAERLHAIMHPSGYATVVANNAGVILERYCRREFADRLDNQGVAVGKVWREEAEGTNAIGTCLIEAAAVTVQRCQHFKRAHRDLVCAAAPLFDSRGALSGALAVAAPFLSLPRGSHVLASTILTGCCRLLEERGFRKDHRHHWILAMQRRGWPAHSMLLAVDGNGRVLAADRSARKRLLIDDARIVAGVSLHQLFDDPSPTNAIGLTGAIVPTKTIGLTIAAGSETGQTFCLRQRGSETVWEGVTTCPCPSSQHWMGSSAAASHCRPRLSLIGNAASPSTSLDRRRGLPPRMMESTCAYIAENLAKPLSVASLAARVNLSRNYFLAAFKATLGVTPHRYINQQRTAKAAELLTRTDFSMAEIAISVGFADQSHLTRNFSRLLGKTPSAYRRAHR
jgi:AraC-like DNA-binding protein